MTKIFAVTGAGGFVGNVLCRQLLSKGYKVKALDNFHKGNCDALLGLVSNPNFEFTYGDVTNEKDIEKYLDGVDGIFHLAAIVGFPACGRQPALAEAVNYSGTKNILKYRCGKALVFYSTGSVYGAVDGICTEESPLNTNTIYGITKKNAEKLVSEESDTVSLRFATGFGLSENMRINLLVNDLVYQAINNRSLTVFEGHANRTFIHTTDMGRAAILCMEKLLTKTLQHKIYNVGDNKLNCTKAELANMIAEKTKCIVNFAEFAKDCDQRDYIVDYSKINNEGFNCQVGLDSGINELIKATPLLQIRHQYE